MKLLLVCEDRLLAHTISQSLLPLPFEQRICHDGNEAFELLEAEPFDLLITEILLPFYSGIELIQKFRNTGSLNQVLILASFNNYHFLHNSLNAENYHSLIRPYELKHLVDFVNRWAHEPA